MTYRPDKRYSDLVPDRDKPRVRARIALRAFVARVRAAEAERARLVAIVRERERKAKG